MTLQGTQTLGTTGFAGVPPTKASTLSMSLDAGALLTLHDRYGISAEKMAASLKGCLA